MLPLARMWAEAFMIENSGVSVYVDGGGTATGAAALAQGKVDFCMASRPLRPGEAQLVAKRFNTVGIAILVAKDALSIYVNPENPVHSLSMDQLERIYTGELQNWKQVGGTDIPILLLHRMPNSGTFLYFKEHVLHGQPYSQNGKQLPTNNAVMQTVSENVNAIGYGGAGYATNVFHCQINGVSPSAENVATDSYPITRYLYLYTVRTPRGVLKKFVDWVLSETGQAIVKNAGYFPIWEKE